MRIPAAVYRAFATLLPALLGQGVIYLCINGQMSVVAAVGAILAMGSVTLAAAAIFRSEAEARLVRHNAADLLFTRRPGATR